MKISKQRINLNKVTTNKAKNLTEAKELSQKQEAVKEFKWVKRTVDSLSTGAMWKDQSREDYGEAEGHIILVDSTIGVGGSLTLNCPAERASFENARPATVTMEMSYEPKPNSYPEKHKWMHTPSGTLQSATFELAENHVFQYQEAPQGTYTHEKLESAEKWSFTTQDGKRTDYSLSGEVLTVIES